MTGRMELLRERLGEIADLRAAANLLEWDMETMMPERGADARGKQLGTLSALHHRLATSSEYGEVLAELHSESGNLDPSDRRLVEECLYDFQRAAKLPESLVKEIAESQTAGYAAWKEARRKNNFALFLPHLERIIHLQRQAAECYGYEGERYNALLESYERGMRAEALRPLFAELAQNQIELVRRIVNSSHQPEIGWTAGKWNIDQQHRFGLRILQDMGFDLAAGRLDTAPHPFCAQFDIHDVRLTTRYLHDDPFSALFSTMHEAGHGLYDQGFDPHYQRTPLADAPSLGIHECNSRMWENMIGRSRAFWKHALPVAKEHFPEQLKTVNLDQVYAAVNRVVPSLIRVEADECTYNLHVVIRFEIEAELIAGNLEPKDVCEVWNKKYSEYLGVEVPNNSMGCLQDVHWSHGAFGYFPTYALGNLYAAQVFETIEQEIPSIWSDIESGRLSVLRDWLREKIHRVGRRKTAPEIVRDISDRDPESAPYMRYLTNKYSEIYSL